VHDHLCALTIALGGATCTPTIIVGAALCVPTAQCSIPTAPPSWRCLDHSTPRGPPPTKGKWTACAGRRAQHPVDVAALLVILVISCEEHHHHHHRPILCRTVTSFASVWSACAGTRSSCWRRWRCRLPRRGWSWRKLRVGAVGAC